MIDNQILVGAVDVQTVFGESWQDQTKGEEQGKGFWTRVRLPSSPLSKWLKHWV